ncbi:DUF1904 domain-containing protein [Caloramator sp. ALD01]|uniref:DUF1904 domain-containing protein n=1 Tax=Caloramator sp. ALD01 TaxID=1031288 RepID=UPI000426B616|nr:DUF1904 domain-containing protein [Caloramator sp. ALD01]
MPHLRFKGVEKETVKTISKDLVDNLQEIIGCPRDYFVLEVVNSDFIFDGEEVKMYPFIEVAWFDRGSEVQDKVAKKITEKVKDATGAETVDVVFVKYKENRYYENGEHF